MRIGLRSLAIAVVILPGLMAPAVGQSQPSFPLTTEALQQRYTDEVTAHARYGGYADQACNEGYPNIAHLFRALAASEAIHAGNFKRLLLKLDASPGAASAALRSEPLDTRHNLQHAAEVERDEIDNEYPGLLERINSEQHQEAITNITYAWKAEQQHRDLIVKLQKSAIRWFGRVVKRIEGGPSSFYVCAICGSTLRELPTAECPICGHRATHYSEIDPLPKSACAIPESGGDSDER